MGISAMASNSRGGSKCGVEVGALEQVAIEARGFGPS
jgi:hypothetical protein